MLTEDTARSIGMSAYFPHVRRVFVDILRALDVHYGRPLMMTNTQNLNKVRRSISVKYQLRGLPMDKVLKLSSSKL